MEIPKPDDVPQPIEEKPETDEDRLARETGQAVEEQLNQMPGG